jgi:class 3 adenylate cyclase/ActR/RegA family two-component response regulator
MSDKSFNILYVDDEEQNLISFKAAFRRDYSIFTAMSADEAMNIIRDEDIHLVITDQRMPGLTGVEFLEKIIPEYPDIVRIVLTGYSDIDAIINAINKGQVFRYISKPWDDTELKIAIENSRQIYKLQVKNRQLVYDLQNKVNELERTLKLFMKYVPEPIVKKSLENAEETILEGELRKIAVLFCDLRKFTQISEEQSPKDVVSYLNTYYSVMSEPIKKHHGIVNQFVGDEIFAIFGAPVMMPNPQQNAVFCALEMREKLQVLNDLYRDRFQTEIQLGIGINYGDVIAGNLGSEDRIDYSVTGDTVNTGKRIEMLSKQIPNSILISETIYEPVKDLIEAKSWGPVELKGKKGRMEVYEVIGLKQN